MISKSVDMKSLFKYYSNNFQFLSGSQNNLLIYFAILLSHSEEFAEMYSINFLHQAYKF